MAVIRELPQYILVAEDNSADVYLVREALEDRGLNYEVQVVQDGEQAVRFIDELDGDPARRCPELLLLDLHLPKRDGKEILRHWRASPRCRGIAVIIFTSSTEPLDLQAAIPEGADYYFRKPSTLDQFMKLGDLVKTIVEGTGLAPLRADSSAQTDEK